MYNPPNRHVYGPGTRKTLLGLEWSTCGLPQSDVHVPPVPEYCPQRQTAVTAYLESKQLLLFAFAPQTHTVIFT